MAEKKKKHPLLIAWAAGVFDKAIYWPKSGYVLRFETVDEHLVKRFHEVVEIGNCINRGQKKASVHDIWVWQTLNADDTREVLLMLSPFLSPRQLTKASQMIAKVERHPKWQKEHPEKASKAVMARAGTAQAQTQQ